MALNQTAYDTTACASFNMTSVISEVERSGVLGAGLLKVSAGQQETPFSLMAIQGGNSFADNVPYFRHPMLVSHTLGHEHQPHLLAVDVREFGKWNAPEQQFSVRDGLQYSWALRRAVLNHLWLDSRPELFRDRSTIPADTYAALISETVARKFALHPGEQPSPPTSTMWRWRTSIWVPCLP